VDELVVMEEEEVVVVVDELVVVVEAIKLVFFSANYKLFLFSSG